MTNVLSTDASAGEARRVGALRAWGTYAEEWVSSAA
jgi:hypothetical protein